MKKILLFVPMVLLLCSCAFIKDDLDGGKIYTTSFPITYLTNFLYKDYGTVDSIYPEKTDIESYDLTDKQKENYSKGDLFIYNGLTNEKKLAKDFINKNKNMLIIDVSYGLSVTNDVAELWLSPNNYLMLAKNIKENLITYLNNKTIIEKVNERYEELSEELSLMDVELRSIGEEAKDKGTNTIVVTSNAYKFLENYGFNVVSLEEANLESVQTNFKSGKYKALINEYDSNDIVIALTSNYNAKKIDLPKMENISDDEDYFSIMNSFTQNLRNYLLG